MGLPGPAGPPGASIEQLGRDHLVGRRIADFGCGDGSFSLAVWTAAQPGGRVVGFDLDVGQIARARRLRRPELRFEIGDIEDLTDVDDGRFAAAICRRVLMHQSRPDRVVREMARTVGPGGVVILIEPDLVEIAVEAAPEEHRSLARRVMTQLVEAVRSRGGGDGRIGVRLPEALEAAGLEVVSRGVLETEPPPIPSGDGIERDLFCEAGGDLADWDRWSALAGVFAAPARSLHCAIGLVADTGRQHR